MIVLELEFKGIQKLFENAFGKICLENKKENEHLLPFLVFGPRAISLATVGPALPLPFPAQPGTAAQPRASASPAQQPLGPAAVPGNRPRPRAQPLTARARLSAPSSPPRSSEPPGLAACRNRPTPRRGSVPPLAPGPL